MKSWWKRLLDWWNRKTCRHGDHYDMGSHSWIITVSWWDSREVLTEHGATHDEALFYMAEDGNWTPKNVSVTRCKVCGQMWDGRRNLLREFREWKAAVEAGKKAIPKMVVE